MTKGPDRAPADEPEAADEDVRHIEEELRRTQEELQSTIEELEASNEELAGTNAELQEANDALRRSEGLLQQITDSLPVVISYIDQDRRILRVNATYEEWFGKSRSEVEGRPAEEALHPEAWRLLRPQIERALAGHRTRFEGEVVVGKGRRYLSVERIPHRDPVSGEVLGVFNLATDLTERESARRERARLVAIVESSSDAILSKDLDGIVTSWNHGAEVIFGYSAEEMIGQPVSVIVPEDRKHEPMEFIETVRRGEHVRQVETVRVRKDGTLLDISVTVSPIFGDDGEVIGASTIDRDITVRKRAEEALMRSEERYREQARLLAEADRRKDEFLAMLGHELRNPLAPIRNSIEILRERGSDLGPEAARRYLEVISRQVDQLTRLVDDLLDVARITQGRVRIDLRPVSLREVLDRAVETAGPVIEERGHDLHLELEDGDLRVEADSDRLAQAIGNVLHNAAKFTPEGGTISLVAGPRHDRVELRIRDSGPGIPPELLPHAFDLFSQGEQSLERSEGGLGLGLALVRRLIELHAGTVRAENPEDGGAEIVIELPALARDRPEPPTTAPSTDGAPAAGARARRILVVDDNRDSLDALSALLEIRGHRVATAGSGPEALEIAEEVLPQVAILDIGLPEMDGFEVARRLRARFGAALTLVALTGYGRDRDRERGREVGFDHYLLKPVASATLEALIAPEPE